LSKDHSQDKLLIKEYHLRIEKHFPGFRIHSLVTVQPGWDSFVLEANGEYIFRFPLRVEVARRLEKEINLLPGLASLLPVQVPLFEFVARPASPDELPFVGYPKIPGVSLSAELARYPAFAAQIAHFLSSLHSILEEKAVQLGIPQAGLADWRQGFIDFYAWIRDKLFPLLNQSQRPVVDRLWEDFLGDPANFAYRPVLIHADLASEHIICDLQGHRLNGIIDWEDATLGDPALDFVGLLFAGGREFVEQVLGDYAGSLGENFWQRVAFYEAIIPYHEIRFGIETDNPKHREQGLELLQKQLNGTK
jgi:aminoglycoside 2''-phosphotransferase